MNTYQFRKYRHRVVTEGKTLTEWLDLGYVPKTDSKGHERSGPGFRYIVYLPEDVRKNKRSVEKMRREMREERNRKAREKRQEKKRLEEARKVREKARKEANFKKYSPFFDKQFFIVTVRFIDDLSSDDEYLYLGGISYYDYIARDEDEYNSLAVDDIITINNKQVRIVEKRVSTLEFSDFEPSYDYRYIDNKLVFK